MQRREIVTNTIYQKEVDNRTSSAGDEAEEPSGDAVVVVVFPNINEVAFTAYTF